MTRGKPTSLFRRGEIIALRKMGMSFGGISRKVKLLKSTVKDICSKYFNNGAVECLPHTGRRKITSCREDMSLVKICSNGTITSTSMAYFFLQTINYNCKAAIEVCWSVWQKC